jgi:hypothetical protein
MTGTCVPNYRMRRAGGPIAAARMLVGRLSDA